MLVDRMASRTGRVRTSGEKVCDQLSQFKAERKHHTAEEVTCYTLDSQPPACVTS